MDSTTPTQKPSFAPVPSTTEELKLTNVLYERKHAIAYVTINRPKVLNALNTPTWKDLRTAFEAARDDAAVRGVILTGAGDKAFIAGADIMSSGRTPHPYHMRPGMVSQGNNGDPHQPPRRYRAGTFSAPPRGPMPWGLGIWAFRWRGAGLGFWLR